MQYCHRESNRIYLVRRCRVLGIIVIILTSVLSGAVQAQNDRVNADPLITLQFQDNMDLKVLIEYVSKRLKINILYDETLGNKKLTLKAPAAIPESSLLSLLQSALRMKGMTLVDGEQEGWKRIAQIKNLAAVARPAEDGKEPKGFAIMRVFRMKHAPVRQVEMGLKSLLTQPGGNTVTLADHNMIIVTDFATNMKRLVRMVELLDKPAKEAIVKFLKAKHLTASDLSVSLTKLLASKRKAEGRATIGQQSAGLDINHDERTNQLILIGSESEITEASKLIESLDVKLDRKTVVYSFTSVPPDRIDRLIKRLLPSAQVSRNYQGAVDQESNSLIVTATDAVHQRIAELKTQYDKPVVQQSSRMRFYKLENTTAADVLEVIRNIQGESSPAPGSSRTSGNTQRSSASSNSSTPPRPRNQVQGPNVNNQGVTRTPGSSSNDVQGQVAAITSIQADGATVTADTNTNTIIVVGDPASHTMYEQLIRQLDRRRPQVLVEATLITIDTTNGASVGVEISRADDFGSGRTLNFSAFGLSDVDTDTGALTIRPGVGFNGTLVSADIANVVLRALKTNGNARVMSSPRILVNDNATGTLTSVNEAPFTSVNASDTIATTSFGGFASAGTTITVTPHISEGDHLQLDYSIQLNNFTGAGSETTPPPRQTDSITSEVTIPNGSAIIVGGLNRRDKSATVDRVPILGELPYAEWLFSNRSHNESETTLFVFIRPVILRDDQFKDLKFLSANDRIAAGVPAGVPQSEPIPLP